MKPKETSDAAPPEPKPVAYYYYTEEPRFEIYDANGYSVADCLTKEAADLVVAAPVLKRAATKVRDDLDRLVHSMGKGDLRSKLAQQVARLDAALEGEDYP